MIKTNRVRFIGVVSVNGKVLLARWKKHDRSTMKLYQNTIILIILTSEVSGSDLYT